MGFLLSGPKSGYTIRKIIEESIAHFWTESFGQIYPSLRELERDGLIERVESRTSAGGRETKEYAITELGRLELEDWLAAPPRRNPPRNELLLKLFFMPRVDPSLARTHLARFRAETETELEGYRAIETWLEREHGRDPEHAYWLATLRYGMVEAEARLAWCEETVRRLENASSDPSGDGGA
jgi:DNA-binding PadR family transcriptional regulator